MLGRFCLTRRFLCGPFILLVHYPQVMLIPEANLRFIINKLGLGLFIALQGVSYELRHGLPARSPCV
jgi:hypothetical protein